VKKPKNEYLLGASPYEIEKLTFEAEVWRPMTESLFDRLGVAKGWRCLDAGAGIGSVSLPLAERVGPEGSVTAIESSPLYAATLRDEAARKNFDNVTVWEGDMRKFPAETGRYDLVFSRWALSYVPDVEGALERLVPCLKKGGALAVEDYHHLGCAYYPNRPSFDAVIEGARAWFKKKGGNHRVAGELPAIYHRLGLKDVEVVPHLRVGGPKSDLWKWSELLFLGQMPDMIAARAVTVDLAKRFKKDLEAVKKTPGALFVVPTIFDVIGRR
jgi:ubiquinone/menaquinone biosynthesis C-methylase UbiE